MAIELGLWLLWLIPVVWVRVRVGRTLAAGFQIATPLGRTGAEIAADLSRAERLENLKILRVVAPPLDWFDARRRELRLSVAVHDGRSLSSATLAAFETIQAIRRDRWTVFRAWTLPIADLIAGSGWIVLISGIIVGWSVLAHWGLDLLNAALLLGLLTLPAELLAAREARALLTKSKVVGPDQEADLVEIAFAAALRPAASALNLPLLPVEAVRKVVNSAWEKRRKR